MEDFLCNLFYGLFFCCAKRLTVHQLKENPDVYANRRICVRGEKIDFETTESIDLVHEYAGTGTTYTVDRYRLTDNLGNSISVLLYEGDPKSLLSNPKRVCGIWTQLGLNDYALRVNIL